MERARRRPGPSKFCIDGIVPNQKILTAMKSFVSKQVGSRCDTERAAAAIEEMNRYCERHPRSPAAVRRPQLFIRGTNFVVLLGRSVGEGIVGLGSTVPSALRAFDLQYLKTLRPPLDSEVAF
jgi:hypothetical protein